MNFHMIKLVLEKAEEPEIKLPTSAGSGEKQESSRNTSIRITKIKKSKHTKYWPGNSETVTEMV